MMLIGTHAEQESLGNNRYRLTLYGGPIAYEDEQGKLQLNNTQWTNSGIPERPHIVTKAPMMVSVSDDGMRRIHPTRQLDRYCEIGAPFVKIGGVWQKVDFSGATRQGNRITWSRPQADLSVVMGGHFVKMAIALKGGYVPQNGQFAFPVGMAGLTRRGGTILADGVPVMQIRVPHVSDADNELDQRPVEHRFVRIGGSWYVLFTLSDLAGMARPVIDPTLTLQPAAAAGLDTRIYSHASYVNYNMGTSTDMAVGTDSASNKSRSLLQFDISSIPAGATIDASTLTLYCTEEGATADENVGVHRGLVEWYEGAQDFAVPTGEDASVWNYRNYNGSVAWAGGAGGVAGTEWTATATDTTLITAPSTAFNWDVKADVEAWHGGTSNWGWWLINTDETNASTFKKFVTSDNATAANRPKLVTIYTATLDFMGVSVAEGAYIV